MALGLELASPRRVRVWSEALRSTFDNPLSVAGGIGCIILVVLAVIGPMIAPYDPLEQSMLARFAPSTFAHWLGTDEFGRDILSRLLYAARASIGISLMSVALGLALGTLLGLIAGYRGGWVDVVLMEISNLLLAFPTIVLGILVLVALGSGMFNVVIALTIAFAPRFTRLVRAEVLAIKEKNFVEAARAAGASDSRIMFRYIFPNVIGTAVVSAALWTATALRAEATLSFLGLGVQLPYPSWGNMTSEAILYIFGNATLVLWPCLAIVFAVVSFNLVGDALRDYLDPRLTER
jgi:peptide/nickel transport system permease protein